MSFLTVLSPESRRPVRARRAVDRVRMWRRLERRRRWRSVLQWLGLITG
jgi:hypothetical protein